MADKVNLEEKFASFTQQWAPRIVARYEGHEIRIAKLEGEFTWHSHTHDELFVLLDGTLDIEFRDSTVSMIAGDLLVVPKGVDHRPVANNGEAKVLLMDPADAPNTGDHATATKAVEA